MTVDFFPLRGPSSHAADRALTLDRSGTGNCPTSPRRRALMATDRVIRCLTLWGLAIASTFIRLRLPRPAILPIPLAVLQAFA